MHYDFLCIYVWASSSSFGPDSVCWEWFQQQALLYVKIVAMVFSKWSPAFHELKGCELISDLNQWCSTFWPCRPVSGTGTVCVQDWILGSSIASSAPCSEIGSQGLTLPSPACHVLGLGLGGPMLPSLLSLKPELGPADQHHACPALQESGIRSRAQVSGFPMGPETW